MRDKYIRERVYKEAFLDFLLLILLIMSVNQSAMSTPIILQIQKAVNEVNFSPSGSIIRVPEDYPTIQEAIDAAAPRDIVFVRNGIYNEDIRIYKPILLIGESRENTVIIGSGVGDVIDVSSDGVKISGFTVKGSGVKYISPFEGGDAGIKLNGVTNCSLSNIVITKNSIGIFLNSSSNNIIENNEVYLNSMDGIYLRLSNGNVIRGNNCTLNGGHGGIYLNPSSNNNLIENNVCNSNLDHGIKLQSNSNNNVVKNNTCLYNNNVGIFLLNVYHNKIVKNNCSFNGQPGIFLRLSEDNLIANNTCSFNRESGIQLDFGNYNNTVKDNICSANGHFGIRLRLSSNYNRVINNTCSLNEQAGIGIEYSDYNEILYNTLSMNYGGGIKIEPVYLTQWNELMEKFREDVEAKVARGIKVGSENSASNKIHWNNIERNHGSGCIVEVPTEVNATLNWWGDLSGPYHPTLNPNGKGNRVSDNVLFKPWLIVPIERAPMIEQASPPEDAYLNTSIIMFSANIIGNVKRTMAVVDGEEYDMALNKKTGFYEATLSLVEGAHIWYVKVEDVFGRMISIPERDLVVDITSPLASINAPADRDYLKDTVMITASGYDINFEKMELYISGNLTQTWITGGMQTYNWDTTMYINGPYSLRVVVYDKAGNSKAAEITVIVDNTSPSVEITSPISGAMIEKDTVTLIWRVDDAISGIAKIEISLDEGAWIDVTGKTSYTFTDLIEGSHLVKVRATDNAKNVAEDSVEFTIRIPSLPWELYVATIVAGTIIIGVATVLYKRRHAIEKVFKKK
jgi:parallel beta-helix repeat protein